MKPNELRATLMKTARDLGAPGRDDLFGAGEADACAAVLDVVAAPAVPVANAFDPSGDRQQAIPSPQKTLEQQDVAPARALNPPAMVAGDATPEKSDSEKSVLEKSASGHPNRPAATR